MDLQKAAEEQLDILRTLCYAKAIARATIEAAVCQGAREEELKLACELALAAYRNGAEVYKQYYAKMNDELDAAFGHPGARGCEGENKKKPPTREGERKVWVTLEVRSATAKERCVAQIAEEQAERMIEQLMAEPDDGIEE